MTLKAKADDFLSQRRIAVVGVSHDENAPANHICEKLRETDHDVFVVNPNLEEIDGTICYPNVQAIPDGVDAVLIVTEPQVTEQVVRDCAEAGVNYVWIHNNPLFKLNSVSDDAVEFCRENGIDVIPGACPMMFCEPVHIKHKFIRWIVGAFGKLPE